jgi:hypothetical protein
VDKKINHSLSINIALSRVPARPPRGHGISHAVRHYVSLQTARAFTSHDILEWISTKYPELAAKITTSALCMALKRLVSDEEISIVRAPMRGRYGVYMRKFEKSFVDDFRSEDGDEGAGE